MIARCFLALAVFCSACSSTEELVLANSSELATWTANVEEFRSYSDFFILKVLRKREDWPDEAWHFSINRESCSQSQATLHQKPATSSHWVKELVVNLTSPSSEYDEIAASICRLGHQQKYLENAA